MFKNAYLFRIESDVELIHTDIELALEAAPFIRCMPAQATSSGFIPPRGHANGPMVESVGGQWIIKLMTETKTVPADVLQRELDLRCKAIESSSGRKPGKKERKEIKEEVLFELLPKAFPKQSVAQIWINPETRLMVVDASTASRASDAVMALTSALKVFNFHQITTHHAPWSFMYECLLEDEDIGDFAVGRSIRLESTDESKAIVRHQNKELRTDEIRAHLQEMLPTQLDFTYDSRVDFTLTDMLVLKKIRLLDTVEGEANDEFDANVMLFTGEMTPLIDDLIEALDGEHKIGAEE